MNHTQIGDITEIRFALYCMEHNIPICKPMNNNLPYDYIILHGYKKVITKVLRFE